MDFNNEHDIEMSESYGLQFYLDIEDPSFYVPSPADIEEIYRLIEGDQELEYRSILEEIA